MFVNEEDIIEELRDKYSDVRTEQDRKDFIKMVIK